MVGPDWPCMLVTYCLIVGGSYGVVTLVDQLAWSGVGRNVMWFLVGGTVVSFSFAGCSDPGIVFKETFEETLE